MSVQRRLKGLFGRNKAAKQPPPKPEAEKARELERTIQAGIALNKFPPR
jgi:hypothetical protein